MAEPLLEHPCACTEFACVMTCVWARGTCTMPHPRRHATHTHTDMSTPTHIASKAMGVGKWVISVWAHTDWASPQPNLTSQCTCSAHITIHHTIPHTPKHTDMIAPIILGTSRHTCTNNIGSEPPGLLPLACTGKSHILPPTASAISHGSGGWGHVLDTRYDP